jgi:ribosomal protein S18 acetylase RimI-like enzyme
MARVRDRVVDKSFDIVITILSIIQGLAFNFLAQQVPSIYEYTLRTGDFVPMAYAALGAAVLIRVFQTYVAAVLDYADKGVKFGALDLIIIFLAGFLEYLLFGTFEVDDLQHFSVEEFNFRLLYLIGLSLIGYGYAYFRLDEDQFPGYEKYAIEKRLQFSNLSGAASLFAIAAGVSTFAAELPYAVKLTASLASLGILVWNISYSLDVTYREYEEQGEDDTLPPLDEATSISIVPASRAHVRAISALLAREFGYIYTELCAAPTHKVRAIAKAILLANGGKHSLGYRSFNCALHAESQSFAGAFLVVPSVHFDSRTIVAIATRCLSVIGVKRLWTSWLRVRLLTDSGSATPPKSSVLVYIAVVEACRGRGLGSRILAHAVQHARNQGSRILTAEVREANIRAQNFFLRHNFTQVAILAHETDRLFGQGARIIFHRDID